MTTTTDPRTSCQVGTVTRETTTCVMYRCKKCKAARRVEYPVTVRTEYFNRWQAGGVALQGIETRRFYGEYANETRRSTYPPDLQCCGKSMSSNVIKGIRNDAIKCDARCENAKGHNCECSCGGKNHGRSYAALI